MNSMTGAETADQSDAAVWELAMRSGDFEQAWQATDRIRARGGADPHRFWTGEPVEGKRVLVRSLHGLGDAVQMFQYASQLSAIAASVTWQVPPHLVELAGCFQGVERVITWEQPCAWDLQVEIMELPYLFRTQLDELPLASHYLKLPAQGSRGSRRRVGFVWTAGDWNRSRSVPLAAFEPLINSLSCELISLQGGRTPDLPARLRPIAPGLLSLATTMMDLDVVITVDTLAAHLAGALGVPALVLLEHAADWRWMEGRDDSPWYSSLRLFRQPVAHDWETPLEKIRAALGTLDL